VNVTIDLRKGIYYHLIAGLLLCAALGTLLLVSKYKYNLLKATADLEVIRMNVLKMEHVIRVMREKQSVAIRLLPTDYSSRSHREILLLALEATRDSVKTANITVGNFLDENGETVLPVVLEFGVVQYEKALNQYEKALNVMGHLQGLRFPYFKTQNVGVKRSEGTYESIWRIEGSFRIPSERIKEIPDRRASR